MSDSGFAQYPSLVGKVVFITGGATGIGADFVRSFAAQGAIVAFVDIDTQAASALIDDCRNQLKNLPSFIHCDVVDTRALVGAISQIDEQFGRIDILVNNVANDDRHRFEEVTSAYFDHKVAINLRAHFFASQTGAAIMAAKGGGVIINVGSTGWQSKTAGYAVYGLSKSAMNGMTRCLARELGGKNVRVNTLTPGWVMTQRQLNMWVDESANASIDANQCLPGRIEGSDIARMALFLASDDSRMITAQEFVVDAGWT